MGIFSDDSAEDVAAITHIVEASVEYCNSKVDHTQIVVTIVRDFEYISDVGGKILREFLYPTVLFRVATLVVLANAFPVFSLRRKDGLVLNLEDRKAFLSKFTCLFVQAALWTLSVDDEVGRSKFFQWNGFPDANFGDQFLTYLQWIDHAKVMPISKAKSGKNEDDTKLLAQMALGCAMALKQCVKPCADIPAKLMQIPD